MHPTRLLLAPTVPFGRLVAGGAVALVLLLSVLAASPVAHSWIHRHDTTVGTDAAQSDNCVVGQFSQGLLTPDTTTVVVRLSLDPTATLRVGVAAAVANPPRRLPPPCGPPAV